MAAIARASGFNLHSLNLEACVVGNDGVAALIQAPWAESLRVLNLRMNRLTAAGIRTIAESPRLANLRILKCGQNSPGVGGFKAIAASPHLRRLIGLELDYHDESARQLVTVAHGRSFLAALTMPDLRELRIDRLTLGLAGATILATHPRFANLTRLKLTYCGLGDEGAAELVAAPQLQNLVELNLTQNGIADGAKALADPRVMPRLAVCDLRNNFVPADVLERIGQRGCVEVF
jgi:Ran GTPase-activating protein (RanGAP) involved in mRNA processing and transport